MAGKGEPAIGAGRGTISKEPKEEPTSRRRDALVRRKTTHYINICQRASTDSALLGQRSRSGEMRISRLSVGCAGWDPRHFDSLLKQPHSEARPVLVFARVPFRLSLLRARVRVLDFGFKLNPYRMAISSRIGPSPKLLHGRQASSGAASAPEVFTEPSSAPCESRHTGRAKVAVVDLLCCVALLRRESSL